MLTVIETRNNRTIVSGPVVPSAPRAEQYPPHDVCSPSSYAVGPLDPTHLSTCYIDLSDGLTYSLLIPSSLPPSILDDPAFALAHAHNSLSEHECAMDEDRWMASVPGVLNHICTSLTDIRLDYDPTTGQVNADFLPWHTGWLLRDLARLAERDALLAAVGMAHLCVLVPLLLEGALTYGLYYGRNDAFSLHDRAIKAYREDVRSYRAQGKSFTEAQRLALGGTREEAHEDERSGW